MSKDIKIGDLVSSFLHVGIGIVTDIIYPDEVNDPTSERKLLDEASAEVYWVFPTPMEGTAGWRNGKDYEYLSQLIVITEENRNK